MKKSSAAFFISLLIASAYFYSCNKTSSSAVSLDVTKEPMQRLSDYNFFSGNLKDLRPNERVSPYELITPLFTDYAFKARFVYVPEGKTTVYDTATVLQFPVGSCLIKNFYYPFDFRDENKGRRIIETRLLVHREEGWQALDYIWNDKQTEALLDNSGDIKKVSWIHYDGTKREVDYLIPNKNQCKGCHWTNAGDITPIGPKIRNLNRNLNYGEGNENQIAHLTKEGFLSGAPSPDLCPKIAGWADSLNYSVNDRARAYLDVNCGHCHNPKGPAYTSGLHLNVNNQNPENLGICKSPVAAGKATGGILYDIKPGDPEQSILVYRMESDDPGIKMPEVGRGLVHKEGVELIRKWISSMSTNECKIQ
jgi:uncharacterized repeat protein (TIGR03806 family)